MAAMLTLISAVLFAAEAPPRPSPEKTDGENHDASLLTIRAHEGWVSSIAFSRDGKRIVSGSDDGTLKVIDATTQEELLALRAIGKGIAAVAFSPDGKRIAAGSWDKVVRIFDAGAGKELLVLRGHKESLTSIAFSHDGKRIASGSGDDSFKIWDADTGKEQLTVELEDDYDVTCLAFSPDGKRIVTGDGEKRLIMWDAATGDEHRILRGHDAAISCVAYSGDGKRIVSGSWDDTLVLWDAATGERLHTLRGHTGDVTCVAFSGDGNFIVSGGEDKALKLWDARTGKEMRTLQGHKDNVTCVTFSPDGKRFVSGSKGEVKVWKVDEKAGVEDKTAVDGKTGDGAKPIAGVFRATTVESSPSLTSAGMAWWRGRLILADRVSKSLIAHTPPDKFETWKVLTHPVGVAVDPQGNLVVTEKEKGVVNRIVRFKPDGTEETIAGDKDDVGTPHFIAIHDNGTLYWSGFPDGGTRYLKPGAAENGGKAGDVAKVTAAKVTITQPRIVHTYGIGLSPKQDYLYVASKIPNDKRGVWRFPVGSDGALGTGEFFFNVLTMEVNRAALTGLPEPRDGKTVLAGWVGRLQGLTVDSLGCIYIAGAEMHHSGEAVAVISPDGKEVVAMILDVPRNISGLAFGGEDGRTLFITGAGEYKLRKVELPVKGLLRAAKQEKN